MGIPESKSVARPPLGTPSWRPKLAHEPNSATDSQEASKGSKRFAKRNVFVLGTRNGDSWEFRVASVSDTELQQGLRLKDGIALNEPLAKSIFTDAPLADISEAIKQAQEIEERQRKPKEGRSTNQSFNDNHGGIKVIKVPVSFPA